MDDDRQHGDQRSSETHTDIGDSMPPKAHPNDKIIVYSCFPSIGQTGLLDDAILYHDVGCTPSTKLITAIDNVKAIKHGFDDSISDPAETYFSRMGAWRDGRVTPSTDSEVITHISMWVLARSDVMLIDIDNTFCPEIWLASSVGIPVIGVSTRYAIYPILDALLTIKIQPNIDAIKRAIMAFSSRT